MVLEFARNGDPVSTVLVREGELGSIRFDEREVIGCQGVFNMSPTNHNGMDERARVLITIRDGRFRLLSQ